MSGKLVKEVLKAIDGLPQFSQIADKALAELKDRGLDNGSMGELGFHDPKFARQILQMTNFTSYGFGGYQAGSFESEAFLDDNLLRGVMLAFSIQGFISNEIEGYGLAEGELWEHSINCGVSSWMIATKVGYKDLEQAFAAGIMHDIGKVVLDKFLCEEKEKYVDINIQEPTSLVDTEIVTIGIDHAEAGAKLAEKWNFDEEVIEAIRFHHKPELAHKEPDLTAIVHLADCICMSLGPALSNDGLIGLLAGDLPQLNECSG